MINHINDHLNTSAQLEELANLFESEELRWEMDYDNSYDFHETSYYESYADSLHAC
ncbi:hypothetical protein ACQKTA_07205 [Enterococcus sp. 22-H-5-01]|uniref:hypothetical protein n=1 Tax=Enterococcus sp. 22-H-5-01 TaxID=3418555 RepID=UPI003D0878B3